ncbi:MAG TPA: hypothetical protein VF442_01045 [Sphingobium sp.]
MRRIACLLALCAASIASMGAAKPADICKGAPSPEEPWTSWRQSGNAIAGGESGSVARLILGKPVVATLRPVSQVQFAVKPAKIQPKSHGGLFTLALKDAARVGVALSAPAWVDVVTAQHMHTSIEHGHGPECSGIRKIVWFDLPPGVHLIQISGASAREVRIMAADANANRLAPHVRDED